MCFLGKRFGRESFLAGKTNFVQENISYGKSDKISKKDSKFFPNEFFLDEVISFFSLTFSLSLSLSLCPSVLLSGIANQAQVFLSNIKTRSREIVTNGPSVRKIHLGPISKLASTVNKLTQKPIICKEI